MSNRVTVFASKRVHAGLFNGSKVLSR